MAAQLFLLPFRPALDANALVVTGAKLYFYASGTSTPQAVYSDEALTTPLSNPVTADAAGAWPSIYVNQALTYRVVVKDANGNTLPNGESDPYIPGVVDALAPEIAQNAADSIGAATILSNYTLGIRYDTAADGVDPVVGVADGRSYEVLTGGRIYGYVNDGGVATGPQYEIRTAASPITNPETDKFITDIDGALIHRLGDRAFIGGAVTNDGNYPNVTKDWYTTYEVAQGRSDGIIVSSQAAILTNEYEGAAVGLTVAARTSTLGALVGGAVALEAHVVNDNTVTPHDAWAGYSEATRNADGVGAIITWEMDARNKGNYYPVTPNTQNAKQSVVLQIASGAALGSSGVTDVSAGINFRDNPTKMGVGIVFGANAIRGTDGSTGTGNAMLLGARQRISWMNLSDAETGSVQSTITDVANNTRLAFTDTGATIFGPSDNINLIVRPVASAANYWDMAANTAGNAPVLRASGSDSNIDLQVEPKGTGLLRFGNATSMVANGTVATAMSSLGPTGASTTVRKWLSVKDSSGTQLYIPCF